MTTVIREKDLAELNKLSYTEQYNFLKDLTQRLDVFHMTIAGLDAEGICFYDQDFTAVEGEGEENALFAPDEEPAILEGTEQVVARRQELAFDLWEEKYENLDEIGQSAVDYIIELEEIRFQYESVSD